MITYHVQNMNMEMAICGKIYLNKTKNKLMMKMVNQLLSDDFPLSTLGWLTPDCIKVVIRENVNRNACSKKRAT